MMMGTVWLFEGHEVYPGLFPIVAPRGDELTADDCDNCGQSATFLITMGTARLSMGLVEQRSY